MSHAQLQAAPSMVQLVKDGPFNPRDSDDALAGSAQNAQRWDQDGRAVPVDESGVYTQYDPYAVPSTEPSHRRTPSQPRPRYYQESTVGTYHTAYEGR
ncbi:hypothetical protein RSOLAG22IIIB_10759 [Rhizoctonia solani]|uniref:Uncharacterized protein n=1 Tax=Rhizoctonia solani TaxID=456999 RepID=A0A0K6G4R7_9AGAM|nr:hypothetical protein RSOLAG22IIIB_10759 [Rhizoctonia solani]